jgi:hypothetical protein
LKPFFAVEAPELLMVHHDAFAPEQDVKPAITEPPANGRKFTQTSPYRRIVGATAAIAH